MSHVFLASVKFLSLWIHVILFGAMLKVLTNENKGIKTKKLSRYIFIKMICIEMIKKNVTF